MPKILIMVGSLRAASASKATAQSLAERLQGDADFHFAEIGTLPYYNADLIDDPSVHALLEAIRSADGVVFVTPEYNYSIPGVLKNAIDWASRPAYNSVFLNKACFVISVSGGALGGVRAQSHLKYILNGMLATVFPSLEVVVPFANDKTSEGRMTDETILSFGTARLTAFLAFVRGQAA
tara:strand:- start:2319 stop:2858 length:540 start_codon:yes stop_codon:yes gene_type:complete